MKTILGAFILMLATSCITYYLPSEACKDIPSTAKTVILNSPTESMQLYDSVYRNLLKAGFRIEHENKDMLNIQTDGKDLGQSTLGRINIFIEPNSNGSTMQITAEWKPGTEAQNFTSTMVGMPMSAEWMPAIYGQSGRPRIVFTYCAYFAGDFSGDITYK